MILPVEKYGLLYHSALNHNHIPKKDSILMKKHLSQKKIIKVLC